MVENTTNFETIYKKTIKDFKSNLDIILKVGAINILLVLILYITKYFYYSSMGIDIFTVKESEISMPLTFLIIKMIISVLLTLLNLFLITYLFQAIAKKNNNVKDSINILKKKFFPLFGTYIIYILAIIFLFFFLFIPILNLLILIILLLFTTYSLFWPLAVLFRDKYYDQALKYSINLLKGKFWRTFGNFFLLFLKQILPWILVPIILSFIAVFNKNVILFHISSILYILILPVYFINFVYLINYFLYIEKENNISNELTTTQIKENNISNELTTTQIKENNNKNE